MPDGFSRLVSRCDAGQSFLPGSGLVEASHSVTHWVVDEELLVDAGLVDL